MSAAVTFQEIESYCEEYQIRYGSIFLAIWATVNGYHHFQIRPLIGFEMILTCSREPLNIHDSNAIKMTVPVMRQLRDVLDIVVRENPRQTIKDIAGKTVGRMPAILAAILGVLLDSKEVIKISWIYSGSLRHGQSLIGDGPKLNCIYFVHCQNMDANLLPT